MVFQDSSEGQTHSQNDGCGDPTHNPLFTAYSEIMDDKQRLLNPLTGAVSERRVNMFAQSLLLHVIEMLPKNKMANPMDATPTEIEKATCYNNGLNDCIEKIQCEIQKI